MKNIKLLLGLILIGLSIISFTYQGITYTKDENVLKVGKIEIKAEQKEQIPMPPILGGVFLVVGLGLVFLSLKKKNKK